MKEVAFEKERGEWIYKIAQVNNTDGSEVIIQYKSDNYEISIDAKSLKILKSEIDN